VLLCAGGASADQSASSTEVPRDPVISLHTFSDELAALLCKRKGYPYFLKLGRDQYACLLTNRKVPDAQDVEQAIRRSQE
jgi:hypothetical protein